MLLCVPVPGRLLAVLFSRGCFLSLTPCSLEMGINQRVYICVYELLLFAQSKYRRNEGCQEPKSRNGMKGD